MPKRVLVFGTFDLLHQGHLNFFKQALEAGGKDAELYAIVGRDKTSEAIRNTKLRQNQETRLENVRKCMLVAKAVLGNKKDKLRKILAIKPDLICLGYDQRLFIDHLQAFVKKRGIKIPVIRLKPFHPELYKSTRLRQKLEKTDEMRPIISVKRISACAKAQGLPAFSQE